MELLLFPELARFAEKHGLKMVLSEQQNFYPDISFVDDESHRFALDLKSTYRVDGNRVNGMTLGAFTGYFRERNSTKKHHLSLRFLQWPFCSWRNLFKDRWLD